MNYRKIFLFRLFPLGLQSEFNFFAFCKDKDAGGPLVEAVDGENPVSRFGTAFADIIGQDVMSSPCFVESRAYGQQASGLINYEDVAIFVEDCQTFGQMSVSRTFFLGHTDLYLTTDYADYHRESRRQII